MSNLDLSDTAELGELLAFLADWLHHDPTLAASLEAFVGLPDAYTLNQLQADLRRYTFLLRHDDGEQLFNS